MTSRNSTYFERVLYWLGTPIILAQGIWLRLKAPSAQHNVIEVAAKTNASVNGDIPLRLLFLGDSIIAGEGAGGPVRGLPGKLADALEKSEDRSIIWRSLGLSGAGIDQVFDLISRVHQDDFDIVVVSVGINDLTRFAGITGWCSRFERLLKMLQHRFPSASIIHLGFPPLADFPRLPQPTRKLLGFRAQQFGFHAATVGRSVDKVYSFTLDQKLTPDFFADDGYHPDKAACREWAHWLAERIQSAGIIQPLPVEQTPPIAAAHPRPVRQMASR